MEEFKEIGQSWKKINDEKFLSLKTSKEDIMAAITKESSSTVSELKKRLKYKMFWAGGFTILFLGGMIWNLSTPVTLTFFTIIFIIYLFGFSGLWNDYRSMSGFIDSNKDVLSEMKLQRQIIQRALTNEKRWGYISFPLIIIGASIFTKLQKGYTLGELLQDPQFIMITIGLLMVLTIGGMWLGKRMNRSAYGEYLDQLDTSIEKMEKL